MNDLTKLQWAVISQLGYDELSDECLQVLTDVANHGANAGFGGFTYYSDTIEFFNLNRTDIMALLENLADDLGEDPLTMVAGFNCLKDLGLKATEVARAIYEPVERDDETAIKNALSWFALEEVARTLTE